MLENANERTRMVKISPNRDIQSLPDFTYLHSEQIEIKRRGPSKVHSKLRICNIRQFSTYRTRYLVITRAAASSPSQRAEMFKSFNFFMFFCFSRWIILHSMLQTSLSVSSQMYSPYRPQTYERLFYISSTTQTGSPGSGYLWSFENCTILSSDIPQCSATQWQNQNIW